MSHDLQCVIEKKIYYSKYKFFLSKFINDLKDLNYKMYIKYM